MENPIKLPAWNNEDIAQVGQFNLRDGWKNHLPYIPEVDSPTAVFYERFIHILEGDTDFDFAEIGTDDWKNVDWQAIKIATQKLKCEEPEGYESGDFNSDRCRDNMRYVRDFLTSRFGNDFGIPDPSLL